MNIKMFCKSEINKNICWHALGLLAALFLAVLIPTYLHYYGPQNFLWLSDIGLFLTCLSLWLNAPLLMSMAAVGVLAVELIWCVGFFSTLIFNINVISLSDYMFNPVYPLALRAISLFHVVTPLVWIIYLHQFGYETRALRYFTILYWIILALTCLCTNPVENINWAFIPQVMGVDAYAPVLWVAFLAIGFPLLIFYPTHLLFKKFFKIN
jgi:hypothetical protein